jgi:hypothetical protein
MVKRREGHLLKGMIKFGGFNDELIPPNTVQ